MVLAVGTERSRRAGHTEPHGVAVIALEVELQGEPLLLARLGLSGVDETQDGFFPYRAVSWADGTGKVKLQDIISQVELPTFTMELTDVEYRIFRGKTLGLWKLMP